MPDHDHDTHVFFITAQGYAGDHWYSWLAKALNVHPELFVFLANEGSRPKYFNERSRAERPELTKFTKFISDIGRIYEGVGDCFSYRAYQMAPLEDAFGDRVRWVNIIRHPYAWLYFYVRWRTSNMRMASGETKPIDHEWNVVQHELYKGLHPYTKEDVEIWAFYRGLTFLNNHMIRDLNCKTRHLQLEKIISSPENFQEMVSYLTHNRVHFDSQLLALIYGWVFKQFRGEEKVKVVPADAKKTWSAWQLEAFDSLVSTAAINKYNELGYEF